MAKKWGNINPADSNRVRLDDLVDIMSMPKKKWLQVRFLDTDVLPVKLHWINILAGQSKKEVSIPKYCISFDTTNETEIEGVSCPYCDLPEGVSRTQKFYLANAIVRDLQEDEPARKVRPNTREKSSGFKDMSSESWTPVRVLRIPMSLAKKIQELAQLNKVKNRKTGEVSCYDVSHAVFGADVNIKFDPDETGSAMYSVQLAERTKLTDAEKEYLLYDLSDALISECGREDEQKAHREVQRMDLNVVEKEEDDNKSFKNNKVGSGNSASKNQSQSKAPASKAKPTSTKSVALEDEVDDDDLDEDEDDADEPVVAKKSNTAKTTKRPAPAIDDDEDTDLEDDEDEDTDIEDDVDADEDEDEDDDLGHDEDEDEDDVPAPPKAKAKTAVKAPVKQARPVAKVAPKAQDKNRKPAPTVDDSDEDDEDVF